MSTLTIFAGINGSGKTTLYKMLIAQNKKYNWGKRLNADEYLVKTNGDKTSMRDNIKAISATVEQIFEHINNHVSFNWETTNFSIKTIDIIEQAKANGFKINIHFIVVKNPLLAVDRINKRKANGGHYVSDKVVIGRYYNQFNFFDKVLGLVDNFYLYENNTNIELVATKENNKLKFIKDCEWIKNQLTSTSEK